MKEFKRIKFNIIYNCTIFRLLDDLSSVGQNVKDPLWIIGEKFVARRKGRSLIGTN